MKAYYTLLFLLLITQLEAQFSEPELLFSLPDENPEIARSADMDNDGFSDLVLLFGTISSTFHVSISKNINGTGKWTTPIICDTKNGGDFDIQLGDLDADGLIDICIIHTIGNDKVEISWYRNEGQLRFSEAILIDTIELYLVNYLELAIGDMDNDNDLDIVSGVGAINSEAISYVRVHKNADGQGNFSTMEIVGNQFDYPGLLRIADMNNDSRIDIVYTYRDSSYIYLENIDGNIYNATKGEESAQFYDLELNDLDQDGDMDIVGSTNNNPSYLAWFENLGDNHFSNAKRPVETRTIKRMFLLDFDKDGDDDIIFNTTFLGTLYFLENTQDTNNLFNAAQELLTGTGGILLPLDFDEDGNTDIYSYSNSNNYASGQFLTNDGNQNFQKEHFRYTSGHEDLREIHFANINGDDYPDVLSSNPFYTMIFNADENHFEKPNYANKDSSIFNLRTKIVFDINQDGFDDVVGLSARSGEYKIYAFINMKNGLFKTEELNITASIFTLLDHGDIDADGKEDLIIIEPYYTPNIHYVRNNNGQFENFQLLFETEASNYILGSELIDYDQDGDLDLIPILRTDNTLLWLENSNGQLQPESALIDLPGSYSPRQTLMISDINQDQIYDIIENRGGRTIYHNMKNIDTIDSTSILGFYSSNTTPLYEKFLHSDVDGDGLKDILGLDELNDLYWYKYDGNDGFERRALYQEDVFSITESNSPYSKESDDFDLIVKGYSPDFYIRRSLESKGKLEVSAFFDRNRNGIKDSTEYTLNGFEFYLENDTALYTFIDPSFYRFTVTGGNYVVSVKPLEAWESSLDTNSFNVTILHDSVEYLAIGMYPIDSMVNIQTDITAAPTRCGFTVPLWLSYRNEGAIVEEGMVQLDITENASFLSSIPLPDSTSESVLFWKFKDLIPTYTQGIELQLVIAGVEAIGDSVKMESKALILDDDNEWVALDTFNFQSEISCAYDPNDKLVFPKGYLNENYTLFDADLTYTIRFQNTGNDTAFLVRIVDTLDQTLDWSSFELEGSSHSVETNLNWQTGTLVFTFEDIELPDSTINEIKSHGYVKYRIKTIRNSAENTVVRNKAHIYFDFNPPIVTNTTKNTMISTYPIQILSNHLIDPTCDYKSDGSIELEVYAIEPITISVADRQFVDGKLDSLAAGNYEVQITDGTRGHITSTYVLDAPFPLSFEATTGFDVDNQVGSIELSIIGGTPPYIVEWLNDPVEYGNFIENLEEGIYSFSIQDANDCLLHDSIALSYSTGINSVVQEPLFVITPNPSSDQIIITPVQNLESDFNLYINSVDGRLVYTENYPMLTETISLSGKHIGLESGVYFIKILSKDNIYVHKFHFIPR